MQIKSKDPIADDDNLGLLFLFGAMQRPPISKEDLLLHYSKQRATLSKLDVTFHFDELLELGQSEPRGVKSISHRFRSDGEVLWISSTLGNEEEGIDTRTLLYDGKNLKKLNQFTKGAERHADSGVLTELSSRSLFYPLGHPFRTSMLVDPVAELSIDDNYLSVLTMLKATWVYEAPVDIGGEACLVIGNTSRQCYCLMNKGFAVIRKEDAREVYDRRVGHFIPRIQRSTLNNSNFEEVTTEVWLPRKSEYNVIIGDVVAAHTVSTLLSAQIGKPIQVGEFSEFFPRGAIVDDLSSNKQYISWKVSNSSVNGKGPEVKRHTLMLIANVLAVCSIVIIILYRRRRRIARIRKQDA